MDADASDFSGHNFVALPLSTIDYAPIVQTALDFAKMDAAGRDASHDSSHTERVVRMATNLALREGIRDVEVVQIAAALHDVKDHKYAKIGEDAISSIKTFLQNQSYPEHKIDQILKIVEGVGFKNELDITASNKITPELAVVQDADRLDAIGAIGIARTFCYGGSKGTSMYDPNIVPRKDLTKQSYSSQEPPTICHFYEKLLLLKDKMKTDSGRKVAEQRHQFMVMFLEQFYAEWQADL